MSDFFIDRGERGIELGRVGDWVITPSRDLSQQIEDVGVTVDLLPRLVQGKGSAAVEAKNEDGELSFLNDLTRFVRRNDAGVVHSVGDEDRKTLGVTSRERNVRES